MQGGINHFDGIVYINLEHREDRRKIIESDLERIGTDKGRVHRIEGNYWPFNGHKGCAMSHINALKFAREKKWKNVLILEDDSLFCNNLDLIQGSINRFFDNVKNWDVFLLSANLHICQITHHDKIVKVFDAQRTHAYSVNHHYYHPLISCFEEAYEKMKDIPFHFHAAQYAIDQEWKPLMKSGQWYMSLDQIVRQSKSYSDIQHLISDRDG